MKCEFNEGISQECRREAEIILECECEMLPKNRFSLCRLHSQVFLKSGHYHEVK